MNRKIFISLLAAPLLLFGIWSVSIGAKSPEPEPSPETEIKTEVKGEEPAPAGFKIAEKENAKEAPRTAEIEKAHAARVNALSKVYGGNEAAMVTELEVTLRQFSLLGHDEVVHEMKRPWSNKVPEKVRSFVSENLTKKLRKAELVDYFDPMLFSRCPSGFGVRFASLPSEVSSGASGWVTNHVGCRGTLVTKFRVDPDRNKAELFVSNNYGYVSVGEWISLRRQIEPNPEKVREYEEHLKLIREWEEADSDEPDGAKNGENNL